MSGKSKKRTESQLSSLNINVKYVAIGATVLVAIITVLLIVILTKPTEPELPKTYMLTSDEADVVSQISKASDDSSFSDSMQRLYSLSGGPNAPTSTRGSVSKAECDTMGSIAKKLNPSAQWFSSCGHSLYADTPDTDSRQIIKLSDGSYCATFTFDSIRKGEFVVLKYDILESYTFLEGQCGESRINIE